MPMSESLLDQQQQQGARPAHRRPAVQVASLVPVARLAALFWLLVLAPCPSPGLVSTAWSSSLGHLTGNAQGQLEDLKPDMWNHTPTPKTNDAKSFVEYKNVKDSDHQVKAKVDVPPGSFSETSHTTETNEDTGPWSSSGEIGQASGHSRIPRSPRGNWAAEIERRERLETHADSHILVLGEEQVRYMYRRKTRTFSFTIKTTTWLELVVTPCSSNVTWSFQGPGSGYLTAQHAQKRVLFSYAGGDRQSFKGKLVPNVYSIQVTSQSGDFDSRVFIYLNTAPDVGAGSGLLYPPLPADPVVTATAEGSNKLDRKLDVRWKPAGLWSHGLRLEYCLTISRVKNFRTHCAALASAQGVKRPEQARWGSRTSYRRRNQARGSLARPVPAMPARNIFYSCIGNKTSFTYTESLGDLRLRGGRRYYIDVFVKNQDKDTFSAYTGTSVRIKRKTRHILNFGDSRTFKLRPRKRPQVEIMLNETIPKLILEISSCQGKVPVHILRNGKKVRSKRISRYKQIVIPNESPGNFVVVFPTARRKRKTGRVSSKAGNGLSSSKKRRRRKMKSGLTYVTLSLPSQRAPIKAFPKDTTVSVLPYLSGCQNVTLEWRSAGPDLAYCVYRRPVGGAPDPERELKDVCRAAGEEPRLTSLAGCISHHVSHPGRETLTYNVHDLNPGTCYRFDVLVSRSGMATVPYDGVYVRTPDQCEDGKTHSPRDFKCSRRNRRNGSTGRGRRRNG
ncbi:hypothetical protein EGW08_012545 [Elysia chlorotica]|uniref:Protein NDNF n=1 Tax=Elysia chlorotica TaxID=188477 RepID=A0A433TDK1_ELYCH|nr:hypothetical protein EGW08_012545 [Elysia chlorotica]